MPDIGWWVMGASSVVIQQQAVERTVSVVWKGSPNFWSGRGGYRTLAIVIHTTSGRLAAVDSWFANPASEVSAHFAVGVDGTVHQYVRTDDAAWSNGLIETGRSWPGTLGVNPNLETVSIETEDLGNPDQAVSEEQFRAVLSLARLVRQRHPTIGYLARHTTISPKSRPNCPGPRWTASGRLAALAAELGLEAV
jgi:N-acetyl-anhydromuramyl-L-alanine amidase AmpD